MTASSFTSASLHEFTCRGVLRLPGLLSPDTARLACGHVQARLARWHDDNRGQPPAALQVAKVISNKHPAITALLAEPALWQAVEILLDGSPPARTAYPRPQVLITLPGPDRWTAPSAWHVDVPRLASGRSPGVQLFTFLDTVTSQGGGTLVLAGSHRLLNDGQLLTAQEVRRRLRREDFFRTLFAGAQPDAQEQTHLIGHTGVVAGVPLEVLELTGEPGDAWLTDLRLLHTGAPNASGRTRLMATHRFVRADVMPELARAVGGP